MFAIDGPKWDVRRKRMNPHFSASAFRAFAPFITLTTRRALRELDRYASSGKVLDLDNLRWVHTALLPITDFRTKASHSMSSRSSL